MLSITNSSARTVQWQLLQLEDRLTPSNSPPVGYPDNFTVDQGDILQFGYPGYYNLLLGSEFEGFPDEDPDGDDFWISGIVHEIYGEGELVSEGTFRLFHPDFGDLTVYADGEFVYVPPEIFATDFVEFFYTLSDGMAESEKVSVTITINRVLNPEAVDDFYEIDQGTKLIVDGKGVLANDLKLQDIQWQVDLNSVPDHGELDWNSDGTFTFTPDDDFVGEVSFEYSLVFDGFPFSSAIVTITIKPINQPPVAVDDAYETPAGKILIVNAAQGVLANDFDPDEQPAPLSVILLSPPNNGVVTIQPDGSFEYTPNEAFAGIDTFTYTLTDGAATATATVTITVTPPTPPPDSVHYFAVASRPNTPTRVQVFDKEGQLIYDFLPFGRSYRGGAVVTLGDFTGDGVPDIVVISGGRDRPRVRLFDGDPAQANGLQPAAIGTPFAAFPRAFRGLVSVASGDVDGDGQLDLIVAAGAGGPPSVRVFDGSTLLTAMPSLLAEFRGDRSNQRHGLTVAAGDRDGDGKADIFVGGGGRNPFVRVFDAATVLANSQPLTELPAIMTLQPALGGRGIHIAVGDLDGDGLADLIVGSGESATPLVRVYTSKSEWSSPQTLNLSSATWGQRGVRVAAVDLDANGVAELIIGSSPGVAARLSLYDASLTETTPGGWEVLDGLLSGLSLGAG